jgi:hypothetical protein
MMRQLSFRSPDYSYLSAWAIENSRYRARNYNTRMIESMLSRRRNVKRDRYSSEPHWEVPVVTMEDIDTIEKMVVWWGSAAAKSIRAIAMSLIDAEREKNRSQLFERIQEEDV